MPSPPDEGDAGDIGAIDVKVEAFPSASSEARSGFTGRVTLEFSHGDGYALTRYAIDWQSPLADVGVNAGDALERLRLTLEQVDKVSEFISARPATPREVAALSIPRDLPVLVTTHLGFSGAEEVVKAETIRDSRFPVQLS
ncbi:hypothetical protein [uncultured Microbacterium sp.]|uniref:hypothetical protein n=1 Tax=uncultured Microbacterium sp. TaxID=191216 RepID=UPI0026360AA5|nr:hypothetical protein [uncultured Microbacterium sp.]